MIFRHRALKVQVDLTTPRGSLIKLDIYNPGSSSALLLGPGQGCSARLEMYDALARQAKAHGITLVRLYWAYCVLGAGGPSNDLSLEGEDFATAFIYVRSLGFTDAKIFVGGKSLGSFVSYDFFLKQRSLPALVLLTPVCTDSESIPHKNVFDENYSGLAAETRPVLLAQGNVDPLCETSHFQEYLSSKAKNFSSVILKGDHGFGIKNPDGTYNAELGARNLEALAKWLFGKL